jgi:hypothetical protein
MEIIFNTVINKKVRKLIRLLGVNVNEIVVDMPLGNDVFNSIEYNEIDDKIYLYIFDDNLEYLFYFDDLLDVEKSEVYKILKLYLN